MAATYKELLAGDSAYFAGKSQKNLHDWNCWPWGRSPHQRACNAVYRPVIERFAARAPDGVLLDIGCGMGASTFVLAECGRRVVGVDACAERIAIAEQTRQGLARTGLADVADRVAFVRADAHEVDGVYAGVYSMKTLHHVPNPEGLLLHLCGLLRTGASPLGVMDQVDGGLFSDTASAVLGACLPPGACDVAWVMRARRALYRMAVVAGLRRDEVEACSPLEDVGLKEIVPAFGRVFTRYDRAVVDPLRLVFLASLTGLRWPAVVDALAVVQQVLPLPSLEVYLEGRRKDMRC